MSELAPAPAAARLRAFTPARVGLGRTGVSQQTRDVLGFQLSHARARDAVHAQIDVPALAAAIATIASRLTVMRLHSAAPDRATYLQRPDLGRLLDQTSRSVLDDLKPAAFDLAFVVADGLSALAVERHAASLLAAALPLLASWSIAPLSIVEQGRVAIGDEIGSRLNVAISVVLIGERPGLSSPDSLGAYITWQPRPGRTDAERNCISNIRAEGLDPRHAAHQLAQCLTVAKQRRLTGTALDAPPSQLRDGQKDGRK